MLRVFEDGRRNPNGSSSSADYAQVCKALIDLQHAADKVMDTVADRVGAEQQRLKSLSSRIRTAKAKIDAISGTKRAITIKSSSRYPSTSSDVEDFRPLFGGKFGGVRTEFPVATLSLNGGLGRESGEDGTLELFRFFSETSHEYLRNDKNRNVGLGNRPSDTNSVAEFLLFNSTELPYHRFKKVDNLIVVEPSTKESLEPKHVPLPPPPQSVLQGSKLVSTRSDDFGFRPKLRQVPSFSLPSSLPDLPMVADISWTGSKENGSQQFSVVPNAVIPLKSDSGNKSVHVSEQITNFKEIAPPPPPPPPLSSPPSPLPPILHPPAPAPPPPPPLSPPPPPLPPPPPPPPPPPLHPVPPPTSLKSSTSSPISIGKEKYILEPKVPSTEAAHMSSSSFLPQIDSQRGALMASIRNPGIALKKTGHIDFHSKIEDSVTGSIETGDSLKHSENMAIHPKQKSVNLLAEMAASLKMRRLSMQGAAHDKDQVAAADVISPSASSSKFTLPISNLQAYISQINEEAGEEEDWED